MWKYPIEDFDDSILDKFSKYSKIAGAVFMVLGLVGIFFPVFMTMATVTFVSWLMLFSGLMAGYFTYISDKSDISGWLKSFVLIAISLFMIFYPLGGAGTIGMLLAIYFFMDSFAGFSLAMNMRPASGWFLWLLNAVMSMVIGVLFIVGWPFSSMYLIGLLVGFSLFFDGLVLFATGRIFTKMQK